MAGREPLSSHQLGESLPDNAVDSTSTHPIRKTTLLGLTGVDALRSHLLFQPR
jgi:hypothetical protein